MADVDEKIAQSEQRVTNKLDKIMDELFKLGEKVAEVLATTSGLASDVKNNEKNLDEFKETARSHHSVLYEKNDDMEKRLRHVEQKPKNTNRTEKNGQDSITSFKVKVIWGFIIVIANGAIAGCVAWLISRATGRTP